MKFQIQFEFSPGLDIKTAFAVLLICAGPTALAMQKSAVATFAGGCFWCMEGPFDKIDGVLSTTPGYIGGHVKNPSYPQVSAGNTGHTEAVQVTYDPGKISYETLLKTFWVNIDPITENAQFCDRGNQYRSGIFYHNESQKHAAEASLQSIKPKFKKPVVTEITMATDFYPAEDDHQDYYMKNPVRYKYYRWRCGRDARLQELWGDNTRINQECQICDKKKHLGAL